jgi:tetratricopeptide (TPR) repeat protein
MSTLSADEISTLFDAAATFRSADDFDNLYSLLEPVSHGDAITGGDLGRVYYYLGEACLGTNALDAAMSYYEAGEPLAHGDWGDRCRARIAEFKRYDLAVDAAHDGIEGEDEASRALATAADALARGDYVSARQWFQHAYDGIRMSDAQVATAALGLSDCAVAAGDHVNGEGYLQVAEQHDARKREEVADRRLRLSVIRAGTGVADDGITADELDEVNRAGVAAFKAGDFTTARSHFERLLESPHLGGTDRGRTNRNLGLVLLMQHDYDAARAAFQHAVDTGSTKNRTDAAEMVRRLDANDLAWDIIAGIDLDSD